MGTYIEREREREREKERERDRERYPDGAPDKLTVTGSMLF